MATAEIEEHDFEVESPPERVRIRGVWYLRAGAVPAPVVVILHGIPRAKPVPGDSSYRDMARKFAKQGFMAAVFNFRGTGISDGDIGMGGWSRDLAAVLTHLRGLEGADPGRVALLGFSAGAALAVCHAARDPGVHAVVSVSAPAEFDFFGRTMPADMWVRLFREIGLIRTDGFPASVSDWEAEFTSLSPIEDVGLISPRPLFLVHGEDDEVIPTSHARDLFEQAGEPRELLIIPGGKHRLRVDPRAVDAALTWLVEWKDGGKARQGRR